MKLMLFIKKIFLLLVTASTVYGGMITASSSTRFVSKFSHIRVSKHKISGKTSRGATIQLLTAKSKQLAKTVSNRKGHFSIKLKHAKLTKLNFKLKASKHGFRSRWFKHSKTATKISRKKAPQSGSNKPVETPEQVKPVIPATVNPSPQPSTLPKYPATVEPTKSKEQLIQEKLKQLDDASNDAARIHAEFDSKLAPFNEKYLLIIRDFESTDKEIDKQRIDLQKAIISKDNDQIDKTNKELTKLKSEYEQKRKDYIAIQAEHDRLYSPISKAERLVIELKNEILELDPSYYPDMA